MTTALDTNVLLPLLVSSASEHQRSKAWLEQHEDRLVTTHTNIAEFLRVASHPRVFAAPLSLNAAVGLIARFVDDFEVELLHESDRWWRALVEVKLPLHGNDVFDARIALCLRHHGVDAICSFDSGFARFDFLTLIVPSS
ncbi:MAG: TA system VapC family ribonuclease toxin [Myxococcota bacterium]